MYSNPCTSQSLQPPHAIRPGPTTPKICFLGLDLVPRIYDKFLWELLCKVSWVLILGARSLKSHSSLGYHPHTLPTLSLDDLNICSFVSKILPQHHSYSQLLKHLAQGYTVLGNGLVLQAGSAGLHLLSVLSNAICPWPPPLPLNICSGRK